MAGENRDDGLAYGKYYPERQQAEGLAEGEDYEGSERGLVGDTYRKLRSRYNPQKQDPNASPSQSSSQSGAGPQPSSGPGSSLFEKIHGAVHGLGSELNQRLAGRYSPAPPAGGMSASQASSQHRYDSFAGQKTGNDVKWYVDGCGYMWAVSRALEQASESIWILDWWLSPELYLRRPPSKNEPYRIDRMLQAAAQRGVKVNIIVYKEVTQALTRKYLSPTLPKYLHSLLPHSTDRITSILARLGLAATFASLELMEAENPLITPIVPVSSSHTKHALENLHPNISVFRHPDHLPDAQTLQSSFMSSLQNLSLNAKTASQLPGDALKAVYGIHEGVILYWAHHEKLCLIDGKTAFMGGLDLCYGRWDTNQHPIADCHPSNLEYSFFPGQDFNNARIMDFQDVAQWQNNKLQRKDSARMGWSDVSISLHGPVVEDLQLHFVERWNFIYNEKYDVRKDVRYSRLTFKQQEVGANPQQGSLSGPHGLQPNQTLGPSQGSPYQPYSQPQQSSRPTSSSGGQRPYYPPPPPPPPTKSPSQASYYPPPPGSSQQQSIYPPRPGSGQGQYFPPPPAVSQSQTEYTPQPPRPISGQGQYFSPLPTVNQGQNEYTPQPAQPTSSQGQYFAPPPNSSRGLDDDDNGYRSSERAFESSSRPGSRHHLHQRLDEAGLANKADAIRGRLESGFHHMEGRYAEHQIHHHGAPQFGVSESGMPCQIVRSSTKWSHGVPTENSIAKAYISVIQNSQHFVYIENQFFITATSDAQKPVKNKLGAAIVERILRAARAGEKYKVIVVMPAVPAFAGDLKDDASLGTRAIMEFQYNSINRGGHSIMEVIANAGFDPTEYIRFYNLRTFDRINVSAAFREAEQRSGINYEDARREHDAVVELPAGLPSYRDTGHGVAQSYQQFQQGAAAIPVRHGLGTGRWDTVSECYMLGGTDIRQVPWENGSVSEMDAFVSEELYVHSKVLIADDRIAICGSANLNDRSQLGDHDSEIAIIIEDPTPLDSSMNGSPYRASKFAGTLRRQLFRKHLGLIPAQNMEYPNQNFEPIGIPNVYDYGSREDQQVADPLSDQFLQLWNTRARQNTDVFGKIFHPVPHDSVRTWKDYGTFYEAFFHDANKEADGKDAKNKKTAKYKVGHVVAENFPPGVEGVREVKELLSTVKGTLVEMPLLFLIKEDIAQEWVSFNAFTEEVYT